MVSRPEMLQIITNRCWLGPVPDSEFLVQNHAQLGPNGLARVVVGAESRCVGHGESTWDCIVGEFS